MRRVTRAASRSTLPGSSMHEQAESDEDSHTNMKGKGVAITEKRKRGEKEILYLDSIDTRDIVDQTAEIRVSVWTASAVGKAIAMDKLSAKEFGKLHLKPQFNNTLLIQHHQVERFVRANFSAQRITLSQRCEECLW
ncbi:hypothetical protein U9M48_025005 [Paspalum notatum var. saurae]|uniref:Uncharacterized protein n=1 Tax=Paspalum notatum var. saurae TaxID=547442 RepID=A0AAQ3TPW5_PASNO